MDAHASEVTLSLDVPLSLALARVGTQSEREKKSRQTEIRTLSAAVQVCNTIKNASQLTVALQCSVCCRIVLIAVMSACGLAIYRISERKSEDSALRAGARLWENHAEVRMHERSTSRWFQKGKL